MLNAGVRLQINFTLYQTLKNDTDVLERCHFVNREGVSTDTLNLDTTVSPTGSFSAGERQLVALARAILRRSQVIIMDEATSQIDTKLDDKVASCLIRDEMVF
jgi:ABC-type multidrug transport system fused ATPase/permease subunit